MPIIGGVIILLQISVLFHAMKTGRPYYWIFIIMAFPVLGCLIYFLVEIAPGSRQERHLMKFGRDIAKAVNPDRDMKRHAEELAICGSVENKLKLAEECVERGMFDEAIRLYESTRDGQYTHAPDLLYGLARARFFNGEYAAARHVLIELREHAPGYYAREVALMAARGRQVGRARRGAAGDRSAARHLRRLGSALSLCRTALRGRPSDAGERRARARHRSFQEVPRQRRRVRLGKTCPRGPGLSRQRLAPSAVLTEP